MDYDLIFRISYVSQIGDVFGMYSRYLVP